MLNTFCLVPAYRLYSVRGLRLPITGGFYLWSLSAVHFNIPEALIFTAVPHLARGLSLFETGRPVIKLFQQPFILFWHLG